jgi:hypothetical protein
MHTEEVKLDDVYTSDIAQSILSFMGNPYSLAEYPMFIDIFNTPYQRSLMKSGRQVSKTVTMGADMICEACTTPHLPIIYANSSSAQTSSFSTSKLDPFLLHSPNVYRTLMKSKHVINNVFHKRFDNFSEIILTYFSESADRVRGKTGFRFYLDEVQDILYDAVIDAEECLSAASHPRFKYAGTSKTVVSTLEYFWSLSTKKEWIIKCDGCNKWNIPDIDCIGKHGLICKKCGKSLNTYKGQWQAFHDKTTEPDYDGYHIPQIILPLHCCSEEKWNNVLYKLERYPEYKFANEVMGMPSGEGDSPITEELLRNMCLPTLRMENQRTVENSTGATHLLAGIDWGGGGGNGTSRTTLSIYAVFSNRDSTWNIFNKIYSGGEPTKHIEDIAMHLNRFQVHMVFGDHGGGNFAMSQLNSLVPRTRVVPVMYTEQNKPYSWDEAAGRYTVNRTVMIDSFIVAMKQQEVRTTRWEDFLPFKDDLLSIREEIIGEETGKGRRVWRRYPTKPDDILHSMVFGWFATRVVRNHMDFTCSA